MNSALATAFAALVLVALPIALCSAAEPAAPKQAPKLVRIVLIGDSTMAVQQGWGPGFLRFLTDAAVCLDLARNGRSSRSYVNEGHWKNALAEHPDYVLIQFGHNDQPGKGPERETDPATSYREFLARYVSEARAAGAKPVLLTSLARRGWRGGKIAQPDLQPYVEAARAVAAEQHVPLVDLNARSVELFEKLGPKGTEELEPPRTDGKPGLDHTHLSPHGSDVIGRLVAEELLRTVPELARCIRVAP